MKTKKPKKSSFMVKVLALTVFLAPAPAVLAQVDVNVDVTLEGITILHYFSELDITIDATALAQLLGLGATEIDEGPAGAITVSASPFVADANLSATITPPSSDPAAVDLTVLNAWAVRSITSAGTNTVTTTIDTSTLVHAVQGAPVEIEITNSQVSTTTPATGPAASIQFASPGAVDPQYGNLILTLDLTNATYAGTYENGIVTLQATTP